MPTPASTLAARVEELRGQLATMLPADLLAIFDNNAAAMGAEPFAARALAAGAAAPDFTLPDATGKSVTLSRLLADGPVVLTFYRGAWCPFCNLQLHAYQDILPEIAARGARLVAVSPQTPDNSLSMAEKNSLTFTVLSDAGNGVAQQYGLVFKVDAAVLEANTAVGLDLTQYNGDDSYTLPAVATYVIDRHGKIRFARVSGDYRWGAEPADLIHALDAL